MKLRPHHGESGRSFHSRLIREMAGHPEEMISLVREYEFPYDDGVRVLCALTEEGVAENGITLCEPDIVFVYEDPSLKALFAEVKSRPESIDAGHNDLSLYELGLQVDSLSHYLRERRNLFERIFRMRGMNSSDAASMEMEAAGFYRGNSGHIEVLRKAYPSLMVTRLI